MIAVLTVCYLACFQAAAIPAAIRVWRRRSSRDLSVWREWLILAGVVMQAIVFVAEGASWPVLASPVVSGISLGSLLAVVYRFR